MNLASIIAILYYAGFPTVGDAAAALWEWSNRSDVHPATASAVMKALGYVPWEGYPLRRIKRGK